MKYTKRIVTGYIAFAILFASSATMLGYSAIRISENYSADPVSVIQGLTPDAVIDPGHGGEDGGASSGEFLEKHINLDIALTLSDIFAIFGYDVMMTRTDDKLLYDYYDDLEDYTGKKKTYDLKNRLRIAEESGAALFIGIHQNQFPKEQYKGLQVYYSPNTNASETAASLIQSYAKKYLMPDNEREIKRANQSIYILNRITLPAVLVECGFMSNQNELQLLSTKEYRNRLAAVIFASSAEYMEQNS